MKSLFGKDKKRRKLFLRYEFQRFLYRYVIQNSKSSQQKKIEASFCLQELPKASSLSRLRNRCLMTHRSRGVLRKQGLSRMKVRELLHEGLIPGFRKAVW